MRELDMRELEQVSGGWDDTEEIIVTAPPYSPPTYYPPSYGYYPGGSPSYYPGGGSTYPPSYYEYAQWQGFFTGLGVELGGWVLDLLTEAGRDAGEREVKMADKFNPAAVIGNIQGMDRDGNIDRGWLMNDGSKFFDTNGNGRPDLQMWTDSAGNVWTDTGSGRTLVRGGG